MIVLKYLCCGLVGYLIGTINPAFFFGKIRGIDIKKEGSGNAGASNALILFGKLRGILCALIDIAKAFLVVFVMQKIFPGLKLVFSITSVACILGHIFPFYMKFKGGKGLACLGGVLLCFDWRFFLIALAAELVLVLIVDYICIVPMSASIFIPIGYGIMRQDIWGTLILFIATLVIWLKHMENISRIRKGTEVHLSFLWNKDKEIQRISQKIDNDK